MDRREATLRGVLFVLIVVCQSLGCEPATPDILELECGRVVYGVESPPEGQCLRLDAFEGGTVRELGVNGCDTWSECVTLPEQQSAERGGPPVDGGRVLVTFWPCDAIPACETHYILPDGTAVAR